MGTTTNYTNQQYAEFESCVKEEKAHQASPIGKAKALAANVLKTASIVFSQGASAGILSSHPLEVLSEQKAKRQFATENMTIGSCADKISRKHAEQNALNQRIEAGLRM